jgi:hypothetical protein
MADHSKVLPLALQFRQYLVIKNFAILHVPVGRPFVKDVKEPVFQVRRQKREAFAFVPVTKG